MFTSIKSGPDPWEILYTEGSPELKMAIATIRMKVPGGWLYVHNRSKVNSFFGFRWTTETDAMAFVPDPASENR